MRNKTTLYIFLTGLFLGAPALANDDPVPPTFLSMGSWVCQSPEAYETIIDEQASGDLSSFKLAKKYEDSCLYMDDDNLEDMLAPYVTVLAEEGDKTQVSFFVEFYKRVEFLHRQIKHVKFVGWTATDNVVPLYN